MKILQIVNRVPWPLKDGGALGYYNYIKGYYDAGCEVTVAAMNTSRHFVRMDELPPDVKKMAKWYTCLVDNRVKPVAAFLNLFSNESYNISRFVSAAFNGMLTELLREKEKDGGFDVIIFESLFTAPYIDVVRRHSKALLVLRQHNVEHKIWETLAANTSNPLKKWYLGTLTGRLKKFEVESLNRFDALTTVTTNDKEQLQRLGCTKPVFPSPTGMDMGRLVPDHSRLEVPSVFHLGSMEWLPNQQALLWFIENVWKVVSPGFPAMKLYLAGRGMPESWKQMNIPNVVMTGEVEDAVGFMKSRQIMVVPLFAGSGIRVKILEGMALGKTIVSTTLGAQGIAYENGEHLLIADTAEEFVTAIEKLASNAKLAEELGRNARELATSYYDNNLVISRVLDFYREQMQAKNGTIWK